MRPGGSETAGKAAGRPARAGVPVSPASLLPRQAPRFQTPGPTLRAWGLGPGGREKAGEKTPCPSPLTSGTRESDPRPALCLRKRNPVYGDCIYDAGAHLPRLPTVHDSHRPQLPGGWRPNCWPCSFRGARGSRQLGSRAVSRSLCLSPWGLASGIQAVSGVARLPRGWPESDLGEKASLPPLADVSSARCLPGSGPRRDAAPGSPGQRSRIRGGWRRRPSVHPQDLPRPPSSEGGLPTRPP